jgi:hypothetical protein
VEIYRDSRQNVVNSNLFPNRNVKELRWDRFDIKRYKGAIIPHDSNNRAVLRAGGSHGKVPPIIGYERAPANRRQRRPHMAVNDVGRSAASHITGWHQPMARGPE